MPLKLLKIRKDHPVTKAMLLKEIREQLNLEFPTNIVSDSKITITIDKHGTAVPVPVPVPKKK
jgi:hypothetical protein